MPNPRAMLLRIYNEANVELIDNSLLRKQKVEASRDQSPEEFPKTEEDATMVAEEHNSRVKWCTGPARNTWG
jgi:hypothetical protein